MLLHKNGQQDELQVLTETEATKKIPAECLIQAKPSGKFWITAAVNLHGSH